MKIQKIESNKWLGIISAIAGIGVLLMSSGTFERIGGAFLLVVGLALWWINR